MTSTEIQCPACQQRHGRDVPHCQTCALALTSPTEVDAGMHTTCAEWRERNDRAKRETRECPGCRSYIRIHPQSDVCVWCEGERNEQANKRTQDALIAAGRPQTDTAGHKPATNPDEPSQANSAAKDRGEHPQ